MSTARVHLTDIVDVNGLLGRGLIGGLRLGADYQLSPGFVLGLVGTLDFGDIGGRGSTGSATFSADGVQHDKAVFNPASVLNPRWRQTASITSDTGVRVRTDYLVGLRARLGYLVTPDTLVYVAPGWASTRGKLRAYANALSSVDFKGHAGDESGGDSAMFSQTRRLNGWQLGVGFESRLSESLSANFEYVYSSFRKYHLGTSPVTVATATGTFTAGLNYRFGANGGAKPAAQTPAPANWTGLYAGLTGGGGIGGAKLKFGSLATIDGVGSTAAFGGAVLGYDHQVAPRWVLGAELGVDVSSMGVKASVHDAFEIGRYSARMPWLVTGKLRAGYLATPGTMLFAALGVTGGQVKVNVRSFDGGGFNENASAYGAVLGLGGGFETTVATNTFLRMEYTHTIMPDIKLKSIESVPVSIQPIGGAARMSLIYKM